MSVMRRPSMAARVALSAAAICLTIGTMLLAAQCARLGFWGCYLLVAWSGGVAAILCAVKAVEIGGNAK